MDKAIVHLYGEISSVAYIGGGGSSPFAPPGKYKIKRKQIIKAQNFKIL